MTYQTKLNVGDIITIGKSVRAKLVTRSELVVSEDRLRGDSYNVSEISVIPYYTADTVKDIDKGRKTTIHDTTVEDYYFDGSMNGKGKKIAEKDVRVIGKAKIKTTVSVIYDVTFVKPA